MTQAKEPYFKLQCAPSRLAFAWHWAKKAWFGYERTQRVLYIGLQSDIAALRGLSRPRWQGMMANQATLVLPTVTAIVERVCPHLRAAFDQFKPTHCVIASEGFDHTVKKLLVEHCLNQGVILYMLDKRLKSPSGRLAWSQVRLAAFEDLLDNAPVQLETEEVTELLTGRVVLVTGAAGSIGSELVKQLVAAKPKQLLLVDKAESALSDLSLELSELLGYQKAKPLVLDITDTDRVNGVFAEYRPDVVFHTAAYKHVPMMEHHPYEAVKVNLGGTKVIAEACLRYKASKMVLISTDKAVRPTSVMGATKRMSELYLQCLSATTPAGETAFVTCRFGNVLGTNGSVVLRFQKQIAIGGPITVTNPHINRYFVTISKASQLVIAAASLGIGGEVFVFDMGQRIRIIDLAKKMIQMAGYTPERDIAIQITGLRPGEKIEEELLTGPEQAIGTSQGQVFIAREPVMASPEAWLDNTNHFLATLKPNDPIAIVVAIQQLVADFQPSNPAWHVDAVPAQ